MGKVAVTYKGITIGEDGRLPRTRSRSYTAEGVTFRKGVPTLADESLARQLEDADGFDFEVSTDTAGATDPAAEGDADLSTLNKTELRKLADGLDVSGRSSMSRDELESAVREAQAGTAAGEATTGEAAEAAAAAAGAAGEGGEPATT